MSILIFLLLLGYGWARVLPNGCPEDSSIHMLLPHETDCSKYYQCNHGELALKDCGPGTLFDEKLQVCNWPSEVNCDRSNTSTTGAPVASSTPAEPSTTTAAASSTTAAPSPTSSPSSSSAPSSTPAPSPTSVPSSTAAPPSSSAPSSTSAPPSSVTPSPTSIPSSTTAPPSPTSVPTTIAPPSTPAPPPGPNDCPSDYKVILKHPQNVDCSKYVNCSDGIKLALNCTSKKFFDMDLQVLYKKKFDFHKKQSLS